MSDAFLLAAAARAYAIVCFADGRLSPLEARRFASFASTEGALRTAAAGEIEAAWLEAVREVEAKSDVRASIKAIAARATTPSARAAVMRAAQAAAIADRRHSVVRFAMKDGSRLVTVLVTRSALAEIEPLPLHTHFFETFKRFRKVFEQIAIDKHVRRKLEADGSVLIDAIDLPVVA